MRLPRWMPWVEEVLTGSPAITGVRTYADAGITDPRYGHIIALRTGTEISVQWVRTAETGNDDHTLEETPVTGEPPAPVTLPELPTSGRVPLAMVEEHLVALIAGGANPEIRAVERKSVREDAGPRPCCVIVRMHSGADVYGLFRQTASTSSGGAFEQRKEV